MFATLLGGLPRPPVATDNPDDNDIDGLVRLAVAAQVAAGLEPVTDGRLRWPSWDDLIGDLDGIERGPDGVVRVVLRPRRRGPLTVSAWQFAAGCTDRPVKQQLPGPYSLASRIDPGPLDRDDLAAAFAEILRAEILDLAEAGCPLVEIEEPSAVQIDADPDRRRRFAAVSRALLDGVSGIHVSLAISGGSADAAGVETILAAPYASLAVDLIAGPDNWRLAAVAPVDRGIVCGVISPDPDADDGPEAPLWAARYAASLRGRGPARVGLATAAGLERLEWTTALAKLTALGRAGQIAALAPGEELRRSVDPRAVDIRSAALGSRQRVPRGGRPPTGDPGKR